MAERRETSVKFHINDPLIQKLFDTAEEKCRDNLKDFDGRTVLIEGGGYEKIWLETQPMGGEMYAKRNIEAGLQNNLLFMEHARADGRIPGSIAMIDGKRVPQFNKFQGFCFPAPALNMYYLMGNDDREYLNLLYKTLENFDNYLWANRDSDGDGCLESWCKYDTGEDNAERYKDAPDPWESEIPPEGCEVVPMASIDIMSFSFSARETLADISAIMGRNEWAEKWRNKAQEVKNVIGQYLWNDEKGICLDRDKNHIPMTTITHNSLRAMYWNSLTKYQADRFMKEHLLNPQEFWTKMPLPSVAVNDPLFRNIKTNNWSGQAEALTYQRAIRAFENYGYESHIPYLGSRLMEAIGEDCVFVQQYDPLTGIPSVVNHEGKTDGYGPAMLSVLEYISRMYGVHIERDRVYWGSYNRGIGINNNILSTYEQTWGDTVFKMEINSNNAVGYINGNKIFETGHNERIVTTVEGGILR